MFEDAGRIIQKTGNAYPESNREIVFKFTNFRCKSKLTQQMLNGTLTIKYIPIYEYLEQISLWEFLSGLKDELMLQEDAPIKILNSLVEFIKPRYMKVSIEFDFPEGIEMSSVISDEYRVS